MISKPASHDRVALVYVSGGPGHTEETSRHTNKSGGNNMSFSKGISPMAMAMREQLQSDRQEREMAAAWAEYEADKLSRHNATYPDYEQMIGE